MKLIADSGASKTDWRLIDEYGNITQNQSLGLNPFHKTDKELLDIIQQKKFPDKISEVFFYGAGCVDLQKARLEKVLKKCFPKASIVVETDILGAARALCGHQKGIACILGTGANASLFDGKQIQKKATALGWILGDEGSGVYLGKELIRDFCYQKMPTNLSEQLQKEFNLDVERIKERIYKKDNPQHFFAQFTYFLTKNINNPYCYRLVYEAFNEFFKIHICSFEKCDQLPIHFTGSVAYHFSNILRQVAENQQVVLKNIVEKPIAGLTLYHKKP